MSIAIHPGRPPHSSHTLPSLIHNANLHRNMKSRLLILATVLACSGTSWAQTQRQSFDEFRKGLFDDYSTFRKGILDRYDQFLEGAWVDYQQFKGEEAYSVPKPKSAPRVDPKAPTTVARPGNPTLLPEATRPAMPDDGQEAAKTPSTHKPSGSAVTNPEPPVKATKPREKKPTENPAPQKRGEYHFSFYETELQMPETDIKLARTLSSPQDYASQWRSLSSDPEVQILMREVEVKASELKLNDYLKYELAAAYIDSRFGGKADSSSRMSLKHFILANMGYGVRLGINGNNQPLLLIPCKQTVYGRLFIKVDNTKYYVFGIDNYDVSAPGNTSISTCQLPKNNDLGMAMDLRLHGLNLPYRPQNFDLSFGDLNIKGEINGAIFPVLYRYPQMPTGDFAKSYICQDVRDEIVSQLKTQLAGRDELNAVDDLLHFVQGAFEYATDDENHGFEKPYFFEETLFYDKCDCEDRAIFYTYLLWNVLGVENHLINYPGHESASVSLSSPIAGDAYQHNGRVFYISDPTYIGAHTGMCMPNYAATAPGIDLEYGSTE